MDDETYYSLNPKFILSEEQLLERMNKKIRPQDPYTYLFIKYLVSKFFTTYSEEVLELDENFEEIS